MAHNDSAHQKTYLWLAVVLALSLTILYWQHSNHIEATLRQQVPATEQGMRTASAMKKEVPSAPVMVVTHDTTAHSSVVPAPAAH